LRRGVAKWIGAFEDIFMVGKWVSIVAGLFGVSVAGFLFLGHGGFGSGSGTVTPTPIDPGPAISRSGDAMRQLQSMNVVINGSLGAGDTSVQITGTGKLVYPHEETLSLQLRIPAKVAGDLDTIVAVNERITKGRVLIQIPSQGPSYKDVTNEQSAQIVPGMDPVANLAFSHAFRAADDQGDVQLDGVDVHHFSLEVSPTKYVEQLKADPQSSLSPQAEAELINAAIQVDIWIGASDDYVHQMKIAVTTKDIRWDMAYTYSSFVRRSSGGSA